MIERQTEHIEIEGVGFSLVPIIPFEEWLQMRFGGIEKFQGLSRKDKEKIFLRWKWGFSEDKINEELDINEKQTLRLFEGNDLSQLCSAWRFHLEHKRSFNRICNETKERIGLINRPNPMVDKIIETFEGREI